MSISLKQMKNKKVASLDEGRLLGSVQMVYLDPAANQMQCIQLNQMAWGQEPRWIGVGEIKRIGVDLIYIADERVVQFGPPPGCSLDSLLGMSISSKDGRVLGTLDDCKIAGKMGKINKIKTQANEFIAVDAHELVIGKDVILVQSKAKQSSNRRKTSKSDKIRLQLKQKASKVIKQSSQLVEKTKKKIKKIMAGQEADLSKKGQKLKNKSGILSKKNMKKQSGSKSKPSKGSGKKTAKRKK